MAKRHPQASTKVMSATVKVWFSSVFVGQLLFAYYIVMLYWRSAMTGDLEKWNAVTTHFYVKGDLVGNAIFGLHVALAAIVTILGPMQLVSQVRRYAPKFHRISGRIYILSAFVISIAGLYLTWVKGSVGGKVDSVVVSMNGLIIMICALFAVKNAIRRQIDIHRKWAIRLFLGMSGVWFFRVFLMLWLGIFKAPVGFDPDTFTGPFLTILAVWAYVFPQVIALFYFRAQASSKAVIKWCFAALLLLITVGTVFGTAVATMGMWLPKL